MKPRTWPIALLALLYVLNFVDRQLVSILAEPIKAELLLSDKQLGLLTGVAFALFYSTMALPIARLAERRSRVGVIAWSLGLWSAATLLCGVARSVTQLVLARLAVGLGEAGYAPTAQSLISDLVRPERRASALAALSLGIPAGMMLGAIAGGWLGQTLGWRTAFVAMGAPGLLLALALPLLLAEPVRGALDPPTITAAQVPSLRQVARLLARAPGFLHMAAGASIASFAGYGLSGFAVPLVMRRFGLPLGDAATGYGLVAGTAIGSGIALGGWLSDRLPQLGPGLIAGGGALAAALLWSFALTGDSPLLLAAGSFLPLLAAHLYFGPTYALTVNAVPAHARATAMALLLMAMNALGLGLGPLFVGALSDRFSIPGDMGAGLLRALRIDVLVYIWAGLHFMLAARALRAAQPHNAAR